MRKQFREKNNEGNLEPPVTEMCDVCGKDCEMLIPRFHFLAQNGIVYVVCHYLNYNLYDALRRIGVCLIGNYAEEMGTLVLNFGKLQQSF